MRFFFKFKIQQFCFETNKKMETYEVFNVRSQLFEIVDLTTFDKIKKDGPPFYHNRYVWYKHPVCYVQHGSATILVEIQASDRQYDLHRNETNLISVTDYIKSLDIEVVRIQMNQARILQKQTKRMDRQHNPIIQHVDSKTGMQTKELGNSKICVSKRKLTQEPEQRRQKHRLPPNTSLKSDKTGITKVVTTKVDKTGTSKRVTSKADKTGIPKLVASKSDKLLLTSKPIESDKTSVTKPVTNKSASNPKPAVNIPVHQIKSSHLRSNLMSPPSSQAKATLPMTESPLSANPMSSSVRSETILPSPDPSPSVHPVLPSSFQAEATLPMTGLRLLDHVHTSSGGSHVSLPMSAPNSSVQPMSPFLTGTNTTIPTSSQNDVQQKQTPIHPRPSHSVHSSPTMLRGSPSTFRANPAVSPISSIESPFSDISMSMKCIQVDDISQDLQTSHLLCTHSLKKDITQLYDTFIDLALAMCTGVSNKDVYYTSTATLPLKKALDSLSSYSFATPISVVSCQKLATLIQTMSSSAHKHIFLHSNMHRSELWIKPLCMFAFLNYANVHKLSQMRLVLYEPSTLAEIEQLRADPLGFRLTPNRILGLSEDVFATSRLNCTYAPGTAVVCLLLVAQNWKVSPDWSFVNGLGDNQSSAISLHNPSVLLPLGFSQAYASVD